MAFMLKENPEGGSNSLRGGKNTYSVRTKNGNWVEEEFAGGHMPHGFTNTRFSSNTALQQRDGVGKRQQRFGGGLPQSINPDLNFGNVVTPYVREQPKEWGTLAQTVHADPKRAKESEFSTTFKLTGGMTDRQDLNEHRKRWITDSSEDKLDRYATESSLMAKQSAPSQFHARTVRRLPGTPLAVERLRNALVEAAGNSGTSTAFSLVAVHQMLQRFDTSGNGVLEERELLAGLRELGGKPSNIEMEQLMAYFDKDCSGTVDLQEFMMGIRGPYPAHRRSLVQDAFCKLDSTGDNRLSVEDLRSREVPGSEEVEQFLMHWCSNFKDGIISLEDFMDYHWDLSAVCDNDEEFENVLSSHWGPL